MGRVGSVAKCVNYQHVKIVSLAIDVSGMLLQSVRYAVLSMRYPVLWE
jgi:hypothetical protein